MTRDLKGKTVVIWGTGKEGQAAADFVQKKYAPARIVFVDETPSGSPDVITAPDAIAHALAEADLVIKSPGVSLYHPLLAQAREVTSLINLWFEQKPKAKIIAVTGTKGKSTTTTLLGHVLQKMGHRTSVIGNIGIPVTQAPEDAKILVLEMSSYQAADFKGHCDIAAITSLYPEHLNWHGTLDRYYRDKLNLLAHATHKIAHRQVQSAWSDLPQDCTLCENADGAAIPNSYLARTHNLSNVGVVLAVIDLLGLDRNAAIASMTDFKALPHRQQELGLRDGILYVDDSIATTPQAAIAAMEVYKERPVTLIAGGFDRGIDYTPLAEYIVASALSGVITMGPSGIRISELLTVRGYKAQTANDMEQAIKLARAKTPPNGVVLLSPAAPSFGLFRDYIARGQAFAKEAGF